MKAPALGWQLLLAFVLSLAFLVSLIGWLQNVHIATMNGMLKSIQAEPWILDPAHARLDQSNYLYFPLNGLFARILDWAGVLRGQAWKQFAYFNAFWASVGSVLIYAFAWRLTRSVAASAAATIFHLGTGFVLLLSVINEDIMPGYVVVLGSMLLAALWFEQPTWRQVVIVAAMFTIGWLIEWRLIFPTLPAFLLALAISKGSARRRAALIGILIVAIVATAGIVQQIWEGHNGAVGLHDLLWTGKGVETGWAGWATDKLWLMLSGVGSYFLLNDAPGTVQQVHIAIRGLTFSATIELAILLACFALLWPRRHERRLWIVAAVFLGAMGAGEVFNLYSQPQDPQMQINVMVWLSIAWALILGATLTRPHIFWPMLALSIMPFGWNVSTLAAFRGGDAAWQQALSTLEQRFAPEQTVFVYFGVEPIVTWHFALWSHTWDWDEGMPPPAPSRSPKFKWISIDGGAIRHPRWTPEEHVQSLRHDIDQAFSLGYRVIISEAGGWSEEQWANHFGSLSATNRAPALYAMIHGAYEVGPPIQFDVPNVGPYFELKRR